MIHVVVDLIRSAEDCRGRPGFVPTSPMSPYPVQSRRSSVLFCLVINVDAAAIRQGRHRTATTAPPTDGIELESHAPIVDSRQRSRLLQSTFAAGCLQIVYRNVMTLMTRPLREP